VLGELGPIDPKENIVPIVDVDEILALLPFLGAFDALHAPTPLSTPALVGGKYGTNPPCTRAGAAGSINSSEEDTLPVPLREDDGGSMLSFRTELIQGKSVEVVEIIGAISSIFAGVLRGTTVWSVCSLDSLFRLSSEMASSRGNSRWWR